MTNTNTNTNTKSTANTNNHKDSNKCLTLTAWCGKTDLRKKSRHLVVLPVVLTSTPVQRRPWNGLTCCGLVICEIGGLYIFIVNYFTLFCAPSWLAAESDFWCWLWKKSLAFFLMHFVFLHEHHILDHAEMQRYLKINHFTPKHHSLVKPCFISCHFGIFTLLHFLHWYIKVSSNHFVFISLIWFWLNLNWWMCEDGKCTISSNHKNKKR